MNTMYVIDTEELFLLEHTEVVHWLYKLEFMLY